jgi:peptidoglycan hydrolase-like protein with peptidoglycan-binding domain
MTGDDVKFIQTFIGPKHMGSADGIAGPLFTRGVKWYQNMRGLKLIDGVVGPVTWHEMGITYKG